MKQIDFNKVNIKLSEDDIFFEDKDELNNYIDKIDIINNKGNFQTLSKELFKYDDNINYNSYNFSDRFFNINVLIVLLEIFNLTDKNTYKIYDFFKDNKDIYNIWNFLNKSEYISYKVMSKDYKKICIMRVCLSYSWNECLYNLLKKCLNNNRCYKTFIWIDIFCVNQFNEEIKLKGLKNIDSVYSIADVYNISSLNAFERYWCCYEMSIKKESVDGILLYNIKNSDIKIKLLKSLFEDIFKNILDNDSIKIYEFINKFQEIKEFNRKKFSLTNSKITYNSDKIIIENKIKEKYGTLGEYEKRMNIYIYLIKYRDDMKYVYLANRIMEL